MAETAEEQILDRQSRQLAGKQSEASVESAAQDDIFTGWINLQSSDFTRSGDTTLIVNTDELIKANLVLSDRYSVGNYFKLTQSATVKFFHIIAIDETNKKLELLPQDYDAGSLIAVASISDVAVARVPPKGHPIIFDIVPTLSGNGSMTVTSSISQTQYYFDGDVLVIWGSESFTVTDTPDQQIFMDFDDWPTVTSIGSGGAIGFVSSVVSQSTDTGIAHTFVDSGNFRLVNTLPGSANWDSGVGTIQYSVIARPIFSAT